MIAAPLGPYRLERTAGKGGMGTVWRATHLDDGVAVAIKVLSGRLEDGTRAAFRNEARAVATLDHPHVVTVHDHGEIPADVAAASRGELVAGAPYLVMEWASGGTLQTVPPTSWPDAREQLLALLDGLAHAHARGVIHRDLKPANVLLCGPDDTRPGPKIADFGIARVGGPDEARAHSGTPRYMAPEQIRERPRDEGPWTDLYALGCVAWEMVAGRSPFGGAPRELMTAHLTAPLPPLVGRFPLPEGLERWLHELLAKAPHRRLPLAADAAAALRALPEAAGAEERAPGGLIADVSTRTTDPRRDSADASPTFVGLDAIDGEVEPAIEPMGADHAPEMPADWRQADPPRRRGLRSTGLGLWGLRVVPVVDRNEARDALWAALREVTDGRPRAVVLDGPAGCGKSRLAQWIAERAHETGAATALKATHAALPGPHDGLAAMIGRYLGATGLARKAAEERVAEVLARQGIDDVDESLALADWLVPGARPLGRSERHAILARLLRRIGAARPIVLWLDDVHWGPEAAAFATWVLGASPPVPVLVVATARSDSEPDLLTALRSHPNAASITVGPLPGADQRELVERLIGLEPEIAARVESRAAGNPLFAVQLVGDWVQRGALVAGPQGFRLAEGADADLAADLEAVWGSRLAGFLAGRDEGPTRALEIAAILGHDVDTAEWRDACALAGTEAQDGLVEELVELRLATTGPEGPSAGFGFAHGMLRQALEDRARAAGRLEAHHRCCADALANAEGPEAAERRGRHLLGAAAPLEALDPLLIAVDYRTDRGELDLAEALVARWREAAAALPERDPRWATLTAAHAQVLHNRGRNGEALALLMPMIAAGRRWGWKGPLARMLNAAALVQRMLGDAEASEAGCAEAQQLARAGGDLVPAWHALRHLAWLRLDRGRLADAEALARQIAAESEGADRPMETAEAWRFVAQVAFQAGRFDEAAEAAQKARARATGIRIRLADVDNLSGDIARASGRLDEAEARYRDAIRRFQAAGSANASIVEANLGLLLLDRSAFEAASEAFARAQEELARMGWKAMVGALHVARAACAAGLGDGPSVDAHADRAEALLEETGFVDGDTARTADRAAQLLEERGETVRAARMRALAASQRGA